MFYRTASLLLSGALLAGCSAEGGVANPFANRGAAEQRAQLAAYAASQQYPDQEASDDLPVTALVNRKADTIQLINPTTQPIGQGTLWVNGQFAAPITGIPANGSVRIDRKDLYDQTGQTLTRTLTSANRIELQSGDRFHRLHGPVFE
jgi:hypothetical protein